MSYSVEAGFTVVLRGVFTSDGSPIDVTNPVIKIYSGGKTLVSSASVTREGVGEYSYIYETPFAVDRKVYYIEFSGTVNGHPVGERDILITDFDL